MGVFESEVSNEYALVQQHFELSDEEVCELAKGVVDMIFGGEEEKERLRALMW